MNNMKIIRGKLPGAKKVVIYGPEGIGKSTFASRFPDPLFIDTEGSTRDLDVARTPAPSSWAILLDQVQYIRDNPGICRTLVVDTVDWAEQMCVSHVCALHNKGGIEDFGYGNGYVYAKEEFGRFLDRLSEIISKEINVVLTAHAQIKKFEQPDEMGAYDRWELKLGKKTTSQTSPLVKEWCDMLLFANYKTYSIATDDEGKKRKAQGGKRVMYTTHHACWDAKNRYGLPEEMDFDYSRIAHIIETDGAPGAPPPVPQGTQAGIAAHAGDPAAAGAAKPPGGAGPTQMHMDDIAKQPQQAPHASTLPMNPPTTDTGAKVDAEDRKGDPLYLDERIPASLRDLMKANTVFEDEICAVCEAKGYVPHGTPLYRYDEVNPGIVDGLLVAAWGQVFAAIKQARDSQEIPFN